MNEFWNPLILSVELASITAALLFALAIPIVFFLALFDYKGKFIIRSLITLPLVLPPSVLGYYLLLAFRPTGFAGEAWAWLFNERLAFSFSGLVIASMIFSLPFMINPILSGIESLSKNLKDASFTLGKSKWQTYLYVLLPSVKPSIWTAVILSFAHTIGEFGVILMIGGNIPGKTRVASTAIYHQLEALNYDMADQYALILLSISLLILGIVYYLQKRIYAF